MNRFYPTEILECTNGIKSAIVSNRLASLILDKSRRKEWEPFYFELSKKKYFFGGIFPAVAISTSGLVLCIRLQKGEEYYEKSN